MSKTSKKQSIFSPKHLLSLVGLIIVAFVIYRNWSDIETALAYIPQTNLMILFLFIPEQFLMLFSGGKIFFSYIDSSQSIKSSNKPTPAKVQPKEIVRISLESNFVRQAFPSAGISSNAYLSWRLKPYGFSPAQTSFIYLLRYFAIVCTNQIQTLLAAFILSVSLDLSKSGQTIVLFAALIALGTGLLLAFVIILISSKNRITWVVRKGTKFVNFLVRIFTFNKKREILDFNKIKIFLSELHESYIVAKSNKHIIKKPIIWGVLYSIFEIASYWIVALSLGHPELLPAIMVGEAIGSVAAIIVPYGFYELSMAGAMAALGAEVGIAGLVVIITRVLILGETFILGYFTYHKALRSRKEPFVSPFTEDK